MARRWGGRRSAERKADTWLLPLGSGILRASEEEEEKDDTSASSGMPAPPAAASGSAADGTSASSSDVLADCGFEGTSARVRELGRRHGRGQSSTGDGREFDERARLAEGKGHGVWQGALLAQGGLPALQEDCAASGARK